MKLIKEESRKTSVINGIDIDGVKALIGHVAEDSANAITHWNVSSTWKGGTRSDTKVSGYGFGKEYINKNFTIKVDEPSELDTCD